MGLLSHFPNVFVKFARRAAVCFAAIALAGDAAAKDDPEATAPGWYYLWAQCVQEARAGIHPLICDNGREGEITQAFAISSVFSAEDSYEKAHRVFTDEVTRRFGFAPEVREVGPYASFREAEDALIAMVRINRELLRGQVAFTGIALAPERLDDEPTPEEAALEPAPFPPLMAGFPPPDARIVRGEQSCALVTAAGKEVLPHLMHDAWDGDGFSCPFQLHESIGIYGFHVRRNGAVCGEDGICTELYDAAGNYIGVIFHSPDPVFSVDMLERFGLIASGTQQQFLYSIPERMHLGLPLPFAGLHWDDSVRIASGAIVDDRLAVVFEYTRAVDGKREDALFYIDTGRFEIDWEGSHLTACLADGPAWAGEEVVADHVAQTLFRFDDAFALFLSTLRKNQPPAVSLKPLREAQQLLAGLISDDGTVAGLNRAAARLMRGEADEVSTTLSRRGAIGLVISRWIADDPEDAREMAAALGTLFELESRLSRGPLSNPQTVADELIWPSGYDISNALGRMIHDRPNMPEGESLSERLQQSVAALCSELRDRQD